MLAVPIGPYLAIKLCSEEPEMLDEMPIETEAEGGSLGGKIGDPSLLS